MPAMKRPASSVAAACQKRHAGGSQKRSATNERNCQASFVLEALRASTPCTETDMLVAMLPFALATPRHEFQERTLAMVEERLGAVEAHFVNVVSEKTDAVASAGQRSSVLQEALSATQMAAAAASEQLDKIHAKLAEAEAIKVAAAAALAEDEARHDKAISAIETAGARWEQLKNAREMKEILTQTGPDSTASAELLLALLDGLVTDTNMLQAVRSCFNKQASARTQFEALVLKSLDNMLDALSTELAASVSSGNFEKEASQEKVEGFKAALDVAVAVRSEANAANQQALGAKREAERAARTATAESKRFEASKPHMQRELLVADGELSKFRTGALQEFKNLRDAKSEQESPQCSDSTQELEKGEKRGDARQAGVEMEVANESQAETRLQDVVEEMQQPQQPATEVAGQDLVQAAPQEQGVEPKEVNSEPLSPRSKKLSSPQFVGSNLGA